MTAVEFGVFDGADDDAPIVCGFVSYDEADACAADLRALGDVHTFAAQVCDEHPTEPAAACQVCETEDLDDAEE